MSVILKNAGKHVLYIARAIRSVYDWSGTTVRVARRFYSNSNPAMEPIRVVQLFNMNNNGALDMKSGEIGRSAFRCDQRHTMQESVSRG